MLFLALTQVDRPALGNVISMAVANDGAVAFGREDGVVEVRNAGGKELASFIEQGRVTALEFSPDGTKLATGFQDDGRNVTTGIWTRDGKNIRYFDALKRTPPLPTDRMRMYSFVTTYTLTWSPDGKLIAAEHGGHMNTGVCIWDMQGHVVSELGRNVKVKKGQRYPMAAGVDGLKFSPDGRTIVTSMNDGFVRLWNLDGSVKWERNVSSRDSVSDADFSPDGREIVWSTSWQDRKIGVLSADDGRPKWSKQLSNYATRIKYSKTGLVVECNTNGNGHRLLAGDQRSMDSMFADFQIWTFGMSPDKHRLVALSPYKLLSKKFYATPEQRTDHAAKYPTDNVPPSELPPYPAPGFPCGFGKYRTRSNHLTHVQILSAGYRAGIAAGRSG